MKIALAGNPNSGKTTLFNALTGSAQHVGNWPGVTVEKKEGFLRKHKETIIVDLPGIYSLSPYTLEEVIARDFLVSERPDAIINVVDASNLERNLFLTTQLLELNIPVIVCLNMMDVVHSRNDQIHVDHLSKLLDARVVEVVAKHNKGLDKLIHEIINLYPKSSKLNCFSQEVSSAIYQIESVINRFQPTLRFDAIKLFERDEHLLNQLHLPQPKLDLIENQIKPIEELYDDDSEAIIISQRYDKVTEIIEKSAHKQPLMRSLSDKIDKLLTHRILGLPLFFVIMGLVYYISITTVGNYGIQFMESLIGTLSHHLNNFLIAVDTSDWVRSLVVDGLFNSIGAIFTFVPQLIVLFLLLSILEDTGYMARVAFILDRVFRKFGLSGRSFIPMLIGTGCSIPGIMASRTIENESDRKMTIVLTPFIPCSAKVPVFAMFIAMLFPTMAWIGPMIYLLAFCVIVIAGIILKKTKFFGGKPSPFIMELPEYKVPTIKSLLIHMWDKAKGFVKKAGTVIFVSVTILWILSHFSADFRFLTDQQIDQSILANIGNTLRHLFNPLGFGDSWAPVTAALSGMVAKEVVVTSFASISSSVPIVFSQLSAFSFMIFILFSSPCVAAIGAMRNELGSLKATLMAIIFQTGLAYLFSLITYQVGSLLFKGTSALTPKVLDFTASIPEELSINYQSLGFLLLIFIGIIGCVSILSSFFRKERISHDFS